MELIKLMTYVLLVIQGMVVLSLGKSTTSIEETKDADVSTLGALYRKARQSRCIRCYDDRYADDGRQNSYSRNYYSGGSYGSGESGGRYSPGYGGSSRGGVDDRNWYQYPDRYEARPRYDDRYPDRYSGRYDDRYPPRTYDRYDNRGYNDRYDSRASPDFRGYGADSQDKYYDRYNDGYSRDRYDRNRSGYEGRYYDRDAYDRYPTKGGYDYKNYRPWDETYSPPYGGRPRPLGGSYLHDRESNNPTAVNTASGDGKTEETPKNSTASENDSNTSNGNKTN